MRKTLNKFDRQVGNFWALFVGRLDCKLGWILLLLIRCNIIKWDQALEPYKHFFKAMGCYVHPHPSSGSAPVSGTRGEITRWYKILDHVEHN